MAEERVQRRLAAILAADVAGYGRLMERDESGTMAMLKTRRKEVLEPLVAQHQGRIFKVTGDGVLVEFGSAVNAAQCAVELQKRMAAANEAVPEDHHIVLRIGVNLGDVVVEGGDLYGDGVIVAARLEGIAESGTVLVSGAAYDQVRNKASLSFDDLGAQTLKNISEPVRVYRVAGLPTVALFAPAPIVAKPSIAVLPFVNLSGDPEQQYFSDGITEDIITELSRFRQLLVIARNSTFQYRGQSVDVRRVSRELGAQYVVEGSVRKLANRVRITAQLIEAATGSHIWSERYDRSLEDVFALQDEVVRSVVTRLEGRLATNMAQHTRRTPTQHLGAYDCMLRGREHIATSDGAAAEPLLRRAVELDPNYAQAHAWLAVACHLQWFPDSGPALLDDALVHARRAIALDETDALCQGALGEVHTARREFDLAGVHFERAMTLNPNDTLILAAYCWWLSRVGRHADALAGFDTVLQRDPFPPSWYWEVRASALLAMRRYEDAIAALQRTSSPNLSTRACLAACHSHLGNMRAAHAAADEVRHERPNFSIAWFVGSLPFKDSTYAEPLREGLRKAGLPE